MLLNGRFERIRTIIVAVIRQKQNLMLLAALPNHGVGIIRTQPDILKDHTANLQVVPKLAPWFGLHQRHKAGDVGRDIRVSQKRYHRCAPAGSF